jgi:hypothetical protein
MVQRRVAPSDVKKSAFSSTKKMLKQQISEHMNTYSGVNIQIWQTHGESDRNMIYKW